MPRPFLFFFFFCVCGRGDSGAIPFENRKKKVYLQMICLPSSLPPHLFVRARLVELHWWNKKSCQIPSFLSNIDLNTPSAFSLNCCQLPFSPCRSMYVLYVNESFPHWFGRIWDPPTNSTSLPFPFYNNVKVITRYVPTYLAPLPRWDGTGRRRGR